MPFSSLLSAVLQLLIRVALIVSLLCRLKEGENQFYSPLSPIKWHTSDLSCYFPFYSLKEGEERGKKEGSKSIFLASASVFYSPGPFSKGSAHFIPSASAAPRSLKAPQCISIQVVPFVSFRGTLLLRILPMCPL